MTNASLRLLGLGFALVAWAGPARAWWSEDDGRSWPVFAFHEYDGSDVNRPGGTPDRPYWHGDDAVPLGMRWQDLAAARAEAAAESAAAVAAGAGAVQVIRAPLPRRLIRRRHATVHRRSLICPPAPVAAR